MSDDETVSFRRQPQAASEPGPRQAVFEMGTVLTGRFRIVGLLGRGGMGEVYQAEDLTLHQAVALKFLPEAVEGDPECLARMLDEVRAARQVTHPNVCRVHDIMTVDGRHFLSMELIDGEDLASLLRRVGRLTREKGLQIARQVTAALVAVHARGILHRDLKPANVMIDGRGEVRLTDFGLAVMAGGTEPGELAGTPTYMSPELFAGGKATVQSDLYALGLLLYEIFTRRRAFEEGTLAELAKRHQDLDPTPPHQIIPDLGPEVERTILGCLAKDPARRPTSALAVLGSLPGGDPLAALVAAGETPSPQVVADAGGEGALRPAMAWTWFALLALLMPLTVWMMDRTSILRYVNFEKPPAVLVERARQVLTRLGHDAPIVDSAYRFQYVPSVLQETLGDPSPQRLGTLAEARPPLVEFQYRVASEPLISQDPDRIVTLADPAPIRAGMATVRLDTQGRLLHYRAVPPRGVEERPRAMDWGAVLAEASLDASQLQPTKPVLYPGVYATSTAAWTQGPLRFEAAERNGRLAWFTTLGTRDLPTVAPKPIRTSLSEAILIAFFDVFILVVPLVLAYRNWRRGRIDLPGANRLGAFSLACYFLYFSILAHHGGELAWELYGFNMLLSVLILGTLEIWLCYLAVEPLVRRRWPDSLISWTRILAGRYRDPRVGRDLLIGLALGWGSVLLRALGHLLGGQPFSTAFLPADGVLSALGLTLVHPADAINYALFTAVVFFFLRLLTRRLWAAVPLMVITCSLVSVAVMGQGNSLLADYMVCGLWILMAVALMVRLGIFALLAFFLPIALSNFPMNTHLGSWYATATLFVIAVHGALGVFGLVTSVGSQPLLGITDEM